MLMGCQVAPWSLNRGRDWMLISAEWYRRSSSRIILWRTAAEDKQSKYTWTYLLSLDRDLWVHTMRSRANQSLPP